MLGCSYVKNRALMKIAISGKGGVGKTTLAASLSKAFTKHGYSVIAIDADPDSNLAATLGFPHPENITPISELAKDNSTLIADDQLHPSGLQYTEWVRSFASQVAELISDWPGND